MTTQLLHCSHGPPDESADRWLATVVLMMFLTPSPASGQTTVGGFITTDTHWGLAGSPYVATSSILIDGGATLTIDPGVEIRFAPAMTLAVANATLSARGTERSRIKFVAHEATDVGRWTGIRFGDNAIDATFKEDGVFQSGSIIEYADISGVARHDGGTIGIERSTPYIHATFIYDSQSDGILAQYTTGLRIVGNKMDDVSWNIGSRYGVELLNSAAAVVEGNEITGSSNGIRIADSNNIAIRDNMVADVRNGGYVKVWNTSNVSITKNTLVGHAVPSWGALVQHSDRIMFEDNLITGHGTAGVAIERSHSVSFAGDTIINNAIGVRNEVSEGGNFVLSANQSNPTRIFDNVDWQVRNNQSFRATADPLAQGNMDARQVWWGTTNVGQIEAGIFDFFDDGNWGIVLYDPFSPSVDGTPIDFNADGITNIADYTVWRDTLGASVAPYTGADANGNGIINVPDYELWKSEFGQGLAASGRAAAVEVVPEPATVCFLMGLMLLTLSRARCRSLQLATLRR